MVIMKRRGFLGFLVALAVAPAVKSEQVRKIDTRCHWPFRAPTKCGFTGDIRSVTEAAVFLPGDRVKFSENGYSYLVENVTISGSGWQEVVISRLPIGGLRPFGRFQNLIVPKIS